MADPDPRARIVRRLAELGAGSLEDGACLYLLKEVMRGLAASGAVSGFSGCRIERPKGGEGPFVVVGVRWDRGFREAEIRFPKDWLLPDMILVVEVMEA